MEREGGSGDLAGGLSEISTKREANSKGWFPCGRLMSRGWSPHVRSLTATRALPRAQTSRPPAPLQQRQAWNYAPSGFFARD
jgi:hypothetical protein